MLGLLVLFAVVGTTVWVGIDASKRDWGRNGTTGWVIGCLLLWIVIFPMYLFKRQSAPLKNPPPGDISPAFNGRAADMYRECPHCKEPMRRDAGTCPHCRNSSEPWRFHEGRWWSRASDDAPWSWLDDATGTWTTYEDGGNVLLPKRA